MNCDDLYFPDWHSERSFYPWRIVCVVNGNDPKDDIELAAGNHLSIRLEPYYEGWPTRKLRKGVYNNTIHLINQTLKPKDVPCLKTALGIIERTQLLYNFPSPNREALGCLVNSLVTLYETTVYPESALSLFYGGPGANSQSEYVSFVSQMLQLDEGQHSELLDTQLATDGSGGGAELGSTAQHPVFDLSVALGFWIQHGATLASGNSSDPSGRPGNEQWLIIPPVWIDYESLESQMRTLGGPKKTPTTLLEMPYRMKAMVCAFLKLHHGLESKASQLTAKNTTKSVNQVVYGASLGRLRFPPGRKFKDIKLIYYSDSVVSIRLPGESKSYDYSYSDLGMANKKTKEPNNTWIEFVECLEYGGKFRYPSSGSEFNKQRGSTKTTKYRIKKFLCELFGTDEDPFEPYSSEVGWVLKSWGERRY